MLVHFTLVFLATALLLALHLATESTLVSSTVNNISGICRVVILDSRLTQDTQGSTLISQYQHLRLHRTC